MVNPPYHVCDKNHDILGPYLLLQYPGALFAAHLSLSAGCNHTINNNNTFYIDLMFT